MNINVRSAQKEDWEAFWRLRNDPEYLEIAQNKTLHTKEETEEWFPRALKTQTIKMIEVDGKIMGYCRVIYDMNEEEFVADIMVDKAARGSGAAREGMEELFSSFDVRPINTYVHANNYRSYAFFENLGFVDVYSPYDDFRKMELT